MNHEPRKNMKTDSIQYRDCTIQIHIDQSPENPFEMWDCEPPIVTFYDRSVKAYGDAPETMRDVLRLLPSSFWQRGERVKMVREFLTISLADFVRDYLREWGNFQDAFQRALEDEMGETPHGWRSAQQWFEMAESFLKRAGIPCLYEQSNGYSQGDSSLCLVVLTPEWFKKTGANSEHAEAICKDAFDLYSAWAWGDVYGYTCEDENGDEIDEASCWGFYGSDHEQSGLLESARERIECHLATRDKETAHLESALCSAE